jgi:thiamine pyrophosphate-dependent acetolactate synthase large subunit-like protein
MQAAENPPGPSPEDVQKIRKALLEGKKPVLLFGRVNRSQISWDERIHLAERYNARVLTDLKLAAAFPTHHRLHAAPPALFLDPKAIEVIRSSDVIVSFDWVDLAGALKTVFTNELGEPPEGVCVAHITLDPPAIGDGWTKTHFAQPPVDIAVSADVDKTVSALLAVAPKESASSSPFPPTHPQPHPLPLIPDPPSPNSPTPTTSNKITLTILTHTLYTVVPPTHLSLLRLPLGFHGRDLLTPHPLSHLGNDGGGGTGSGPGNAVGAALALKHTRSALLPVAVLGDGDFLMGSAALWTAVRHRIPLLVVVANNQSFYNDERHQREVAAATGRAVGNAGVGTRIEDPAPDLMGVAVALGARRVVGGQVRGRGELEGVLERAVRAVREGAVVVVDVLVPPDD